MDISILITYLFIYRTRGYIIVSNNIYMVVPIRNQSLQINFIWILKRNKVIDIEILTIDFKLDLYIYIFFTYMKLKFF